MSSRRVQRIAEQIGQEVARLIVSEAKDAALRVVEITGARISPDLTVVHLTFVAIGGENDKALQALERANGFLRREVAQRIGLRRAPELHFHVDTSLERGLHMDRVLHDLREAGAMGKDDEET